MAIEREIVLTVEVVEPYTKEVLLAFGVESNSAEEYAFFLGWQDGVTNHIEPRPPVTGDQLPHYCNGWVLGSWNRVVWILQGACEALKAE